MQVSKYLLIYYGSDSSCILSHWKYSKPSAEDVFTEQTGTEGINDLGE